MSYRNNRHARSTHADNLPGTVPDKLQPHNVEAEEAVLGSLLIDPKAVALVISFLRPEDFFVERHGWIFEAIHDLYDRNEPADLVTLCDELECRVQLKEVGDRPFLTSLINATPTAVHLEHYAHIVERKARRRRAIEAAGKIARLAFDEAVADSDLDTQLDEIWRSEVSGRPGSEPVFKRLGFDELMLQPDRDWLIGQVLARGELGMIFGDPGSGKTLVVIDLAMDAVLGRQWAKNFDIRKPLRVAYCAGEGTGGLKNRFDAAAKARLVGSSHLINLSIFTNVPQFFQQVPGSIQRFIAECEAGRLSFDLLIIDTQHAATVGADENSARDAGLILSSARYAIQKLNCAILFLHHSNRAGSGERGSGAFRGAMDVIIEVSKQAGQHMMYCSKLKDGEEFRAQAFTLAKSGESVYPAWSGPAQEPTSEPQSRTRLLAEMDNRPGARFTARQLSEVINMSPTATSNLLNRLGDEGRIKRELQDESKQPSSRNPWVYFSELDF